MVGPTVFHDAIRTGARLRTPVRAGVHGLRPAARSGDGGGLTPRGAEARPRFFSGFLASPQVAARGLLAVADVAAARYHQRIRPGSLDPVVTGNGDRLRFESFSGCGGVYARLDVLDEALGGTETGHGTTNVDVNDPLREALSRMAGTIRCTCGSAPTRWR